MTAPRDWDKELAQIDKLMDKPSARVPATTGGPAVPPARAQPTGPAPVTRKAVLGTWFRVLLGLVLGGAMTQWPYAHPCGFGLFMYLGSAGVVTLAGLWGALGSWRRRMGLAHTLSLLVTLWGLILVASAVLPRTGYAKVAQTWMCP
jgi:hypothetical protein